MQGRRRIGHSLGKKKDRALEWAMKECVGRDRNRKEAEREEIENYWV